MEDLMVVVVQMRQVMTTSVRVVGGEPQISALEVMNYTTGWLSLEVEVALEVGLVATEEMQEGN